MVTYASTINQQPELFKHPFGAHLRPDHRLVLMANQIPWDHLAAYYAKSLCPNNGRPTINLRIILGTLILQQIENLSDRRVVAYISENLYAQFFIGLPGFVPRPPFAPTLLVAIRKRLGETGAKQLNAIVCLALRNQPIDPADFITEPDEADLPPDLTPGPPSSGSDHNPLESPFDKPDNGTQGTDHQNNTSGFEPVHPPALATQDDLAHPFQASEGLSPKPPTHAGTLIVDATVAVAPITYPTDTALLNTAREHAERLIDKLWLLARTASGAAQRKPRTHRLRARKLAVNFSKTKNKDSDLIRSQIKAQLKFLKRNLTTIKKLCHLIEADKRDLPLTRQDQITALIILEIYQQQRTMYTHKSHTIADRIVSVEQWHLRPIKRGKSGGRLTEFGPKLNASLADGYVSVDYVAFAAFNEAKDLIAQVKRYHAIYGHWPEVVLADRIYFTRENRHFLAAHAIESNAVKLGPQTELTQAERKLGAKRHGMRSYVEGKFGELKTRYSLGRLRTKRQATQLCEVSMACLASNLARWLRGLFSTLARMIEHLLWSPRTTLIPTTSYHQTHKFIPASH